MKQCSSHEKTSIAYNTCKDNFDNKYVNSIEGGSAFTIKTEAKTVLVKNLTNR